jgi:hypothetical protein
MPSLQSTLNSSLFYLILYLILIVVLPAAAELSRESTQEEAGKSDQVQREQGVTRVQGAAVTGEAEQWQWTTEESQEAHRLHIQGAGGTTRPLQDAHAHVHGRIVS